MEYLCLVLLQVAKLEIPVKLCVKSYLCLLTPILTPNFKLNNHFKAFIMYSKEQH